MPVHEHILAHNAIRSWGGGIVFLLDDQFTDGPVADPISSPRNAVPGPGKLVIVHDLGTVEITAANKLEITGNGSWSSATCIWTDDDDNGFADAPGLVNKTRAVIGSTLTLGPGFSHLAVPTNRLGAAFNKLANISLNLSTAAPLQTWTTAEQTFFAVSRNPGAVMLYINPSNELEVLWFTRKSIAATVWPCAISRTDKQTLVTNQLYMALGTSWATTEAMLDVYKAGSFSDPEIFTTEPDAQINFTGLATGETIDVEFRRQDNDNKWIARYDWDDLTMKIIEVTATVEVERASQVIDTIEAENEIQFKGSTIKIHHANSRFSVAYGSATAFQTATDARIVGATATQTHLEVMRFNLDGTQRKTDLGI